MDYQIIKDYNYSTEDINDLVIKNGNENYDYFKEICHLFMVGTTIISANQMNAENKVPKSISFPIIEVIVDPSFRIEEYEKNAFSLEDYSFYNTKSNTRSLTERILSFKSLQESWDGYGAIPLEIKSACNAIDFINFLSEKNVYIDPTDIFPNPHGTISFIWENLYDERLSLEVGNNSLSYYSLFNGSKPEFFNDVELIDNNIENISRKINSLF